MLTRNFIIIYSTVISFAILYEQQPLGIFMLGQVSSYDCKTKGMAVSYRLFQGSGIVRWFISHDQPHINNDTPADQCKPANLAT